MATSSVLWQNDRKTVILLDLVRSIEEAQIPSSELAANNGRPPATLRRLVSALPPASPFPTPEPKRGSSEPPTTSPSAQIADLMTQAAVESALEEIRASHEGLWCLPRVTSSPKQKPTEEEEEAQAPAAGPTTTDSPSLSPPQPQPPPSSTDGDTPPAPFDHRLYHLPPNSHPLLGTIPIPTNTASSTPGGSRPIPSAAAAAAAADLPSDLRFDLILLDPPWPNRSAKRKRAGAGAYRPAPDLSSVRALLRQVPVASRLSPGGLVAVWVTNAARFADLLLGTGGGGGGRGLFSEWDVEPVGEWTWLKITAGGEPVVPVGSAWRKPWERLLIARKRTAAGEGGSRTGPVEGKVIAAVPDVHSRKPNLRGLFEELLPERYEALEVFARNLTAGWWAWGDEVLLFQRRECWVEGKWG